MGLTLHIRQSFNYNVWDWIFFNVRDSKSCYNELNWNVIFRFALWHIGKNRCKKVFEDIPSHITLSSPFVCKATNDWICANLSCHCKDAKVEVFPAWDFAFCWVVETEC